MPNVYIEPRPKGRKKASRLRITWSRITRIMS